MGPRRAEGVGPRRKFRAFFPLPPPFRSFFCVSLGVFSWILASAGTLKMCTLGVLGLSCETLAAPMVRQQGNGLKACEEQPGDKVSVLPARG